MNATLTRLIALGAIALSFSAASSAQECPDATAVTVGSTPFSSSGASTGQLVESSATGLTSTIFGPRWFRFTPSATGNYEISVCGSAGDTKMAIGAACPASPDSAMATLGYNDDSCPCTSGCGTTGTIAWSSRLNLSNSGRPLTAQLQAGITYRILVGGFGATTGVVSGNLVIAPIAPPQPPNTCTNPAAGLLGNNNVTLDPTGTQLTGLCTSPLNRPGYVRFVPPANGSYSADTCSGSLDTVVAAMTICGDSGSIVACNDDACGLASSVVFQGTQGEPIFIAVGLWSTAGTPPAGPVTLTISQAQPPNTCAQPLDGVLGSNTVRLDPNGDPLAVDCGFDGNPLSKPGYVRFVPPATGLYAADTCAATQDTIVAAMTTCGDVGTVIACNDDSCGLRSKVVFEGTQGQPVFIAVGLWSPTATPPINGIQLTIAEIEDPCDSPTNAIVGDNTLATDPNALDLDLAGICDPGTFGDDVVARATYLRFVAPETRSYRVGTCAGQDDTRIAVLTTCGDAASTIACDDDGCGTPDDDWWASTMVFEATAGTTYFIAVGAYQEPGFTAPLPPEITVNISTDVDPPPPFDPCASENIGTAILGTNTVVPNAQYPALDVTGSPCVFDFAPQAIARAKYLRFTANATGTYLFEQCGDTGTTVDARMGLMTACGDASSFLICDDDGCTGGAPFFTSRFQYDLTAGQVVFLVVGGYSAAATGPLNVLITGPGSGGCQPDLNNDGVVNGDDLGVLLFQWGPCSGCSADFNGSGFVNGDDLGQLLGAWGPCP